MRKEAKEDSQVLGLNNWKDKLVSCQELRQDVREGHGRGGEESGEGKGQRPLSSWNKGICWTTRWNLAEQQGREQNQAAPGDRQYSPSPQLSGDLISFGLLSDRPGFAFCQPISSAPCLLPLSSNSHLYL